MKQLDRLIKHDLVKGLRMFTLRRIDNIVLVKLENKSQTHIQTRT
jgi:hypothetical protein